MTKPITPHPEHIVPDLPMHARAPRVEPGEPVDAALLAEDAYYRAMERESQKMRKRKGNARGRAVAIAAVGAVLIIGLLMRR